jgi:20S proteasome alpha/beta subunit
MTLVAGFRCRNGGVLLCADREEDDGYNKREVDKLFRIPVTQIGECDVFLAGAGLSSLLMKAKMAILERFVEVKEARDAAQKKAQETGQPVEDVGSIFRDHKSLIENSLKLLYENYAKELEANPLAFVVVVAPYVASRVPMIYKTERVMLVDCPEYCAVGTGQPIADYFSDRLFHYDRMERPLLAILAAFILREAQHSASGVGLGNDMILIHDGERSLRYIYKDYIKQLQDCIPSVEDAIFVNWKERVTIPEWLA